MHCLLLSLLSLDFFIILIFLYQNILSPEKMVLQKTEKIQIKHIFYPILKLFG